MTSQCCASFGFLSEPRSSSVGDEWLEKEGSQSSYRQWIVDRVKDARLEDDGVGQSDDREPARQLLESCSMMLVRHLQQAYSRAGEKRSGLNCKQDRLYHAGM